jgi:hypothetical protein
MPEYAQAGRLEFFNGAIAVEKSSDRCEQRQGFRAATWERTGK